MDNEAIQRINLYREMMNSWAFKDFRLKAQNMLETESNKIDMVPLTGDGMIQVAEARGARKALKNLFEEADSIVA